MPEFYRKCQTLRILIRFFTEMCNKGLNITDYTYDTIYITCAQYENLLISNINLSQVHIPTRFLSFQ